jgi:hypothetical protein
VKKTARQLDLTQRRQETRGQRSNNGIFHLRLSPGKGAKKQLAKTFAFLHIIQQEHSINFPFLLFYCTNIDVFNSSSFADFSGCSGQADAGVRGCSGWGLVKS